MSSAHNPRREWRPVSKSAPCPACGKPDWCAWSADGWLKCERSTETPPDMWRVSNKDGGAVFKPDDGGPTRNGRAPKPKAGKPRRSTPKGSGDGDAPPVFATAAAAITKYEKRLGRRAAHWTYHDADGEPVAVVVRWDKADGSKDTRPVSRTAVGWVQRALPAPRPLYRLPQLLASPEGSTVWVFEGEKSAGCGAALGLASTTASGGANGAAHADWSPVAGHDVVLSVDHNEPGERYGRYAAAGTLAAGARSVRIVRLSEHYINLPDGGDVVDALELAGGDADAVREVLERLAAEAEPEERDTPEPERAPVFDPARLFPPRCADVRDYLADLSRSTQTPPEMSAVLSLAILSGCIANVAEVRGFGDHVEPAQIWALMLSDPGTRKSAVLAELTRPVFRWEHEQAEVMGPTIAEAAQARAIDEKRLRYLQDRSAKDANADERERFRFEAVELASQLEAEPVPKPPVLIVSEPTPEALGLQMAGNGGRALLTSAEADVVDVVLGLYSGRSNFGILLKGHSGDPVRERRVGREPVCIDHPALAVALLVQPAAVEALYSDRQAEGRGLLARFAVVAVENLLGSREVRPKPVRERLRDGWHAAIGGLLRQSPTDEPLIVRLSAEADALYLDFQRWAERELGCGVLANRAEWGGKLCGLVLRVALTLHALGTWAHRGTPADAGTIDAETMAAAIEWGRYFAEAERHARGRIAETPEDRERAKLIAWIWGRGGSVTVRELAKSGLAAYRSKADTAQTALDELVADGIAEWVQPVQSGPGRPRSRRCILKGTPPDPDPKTPPESLGPVVSGSGSDGSDGLHADVWDSL
jgi:uncharacterized protein DUF3987